MTTEKKLRARSEISKTATRLEKARDDRRKLVARHASMDLSLRAKIAELDAEITEGMKTLEAFLAGPEAPKVRTAELHDYEPEPGGEG